MTHFAPVLRRAVPAFALLAALTACAPPAPSAGPPKATPEAQAVTPTATPDPAEAKFLALADKQMRTGASKDLRTHDNATWLKWGRQYCKDRRSGADSYDAYSNIIASESGAPPERTEVARAGMVASSTLCPEFQIK